jgi:cytochrome c oxidase subunit I
MTTEHTRPGQTRQGKSYLEDGYTIRSWLLSTDHKRIAFLYLVALTIMFLVGGAAAVLLRLELITPDANLVSADGYNKLFTLHGVIMIFFFLVPSIPAVFGNFLIPMMVGAKDMAFPRLNLASWYIFVTGATFGVVVIIVGGVDTGWTFYTPYSSTYSNTYVILAVAGAFIAGFSSILTGLNIITTVYAMRAPGLTWMRLPLFVWSLLATSLIIMLATPVVAITLALVAVERATGIGIFDPALGGDPVLFQHLFWFYSHPAVYIMILPSLGVISEIIACFARKRIYGYPFVAGASIAIAVLGFLVWGHHMFVSGQSVYAGVAFSFLSFLVAIPSAVKVFNWTATLHRGEIRITTPMLYAFGFIGLFVVGGLTGLFTATVAVNVHIHDTYFVVAHFHFIMVGGALMGYLGALHFWWPKMTGRMYWERLARWSAILVFLGFFLTFFPQFILGYQGMPRRYHVYPDDFALLNVFSSGGAVFLGLGYLLPALYLTASLRWGKPAGPNPWRAKGLEWERADSPPISENFAEIPRVTEPAYNYERGGRHDDT